MLRFWAVISVTLAITWLIGCKDSPVAVVPDPTVTGVWSGDYVATGGSIVRFTGTFAEDSTGAITGSANVRVGELGLVLVVRGGTHNYPQVSVTLGFVGVDDFTYAGQMSSDGQQIVGALNGSGFDNVGLNLTR